MAAGIYRRLSNGMLRRLVQRFQAEATGGTQEGLRTGAYLLGRGQRRELLGQRGVKPLVIWFFVAGIESGIHSREDCVLEGPGSGCSACGESGLAWIRLSACGSPSPILTNQGSRLHAALST